MKQVENLLVFWWFIEEFNRSFLVSFTSEGIFCKAESFLIHGDYDRDTKEFKQNVNLRSIGAVRHYDLKVDDQGEIKCECLDCTNKRTTQLLELVGARVPWVDAREVCDVCYKRFQGPEKEKDIKEFFDNFDEDEWQKERVNFRKNFR